MRAWLLELRHEGMRVKRECGASDRVEGFVWCDAQTGKTRTFDCVVFRRLTDPHPVANWRERFALMSAQ